MRFLYLTLGLLTCVTGYSLKLLSKLHFRRGIQNSRSRLWSESVDGEENSSENIENITWGDKNIEALVDEASDESLEHAVKQIIGDLTPKASDVTPADKFKQIYKVKSMFFNRNSMK